MADTAERPYSRRAFWAGVAVATFGLVVVWLGALGAIFQSDACGEERTWFCEGGGQQFIGWVMILGGPVALLAGIVVAAASRPARRWAMWAVVAAEALSVVVMSVVASNGV